MSHDRPKSLEKPLEPQIPPPGFDPLRADDATLEHFWLPARPNQELWPELYAHWHQMMSPTPKFVSANSVRMFEFAPPTTTTTAPLELRVRSRMQSSRNWSGAYLEASHANRFTRVVGRWTVPTLGLGVRDAGVPHEELMPFQCSIWVGLDGKKLWQGAMPQVGSVHSIGDDYIENHSLWWQWWERITPQGQQPSLPWTITGVPINRGDVILCSLTVQGGDRKTARFHVCNRTSRLFATVQVTNHVILGSTAQWIVERPANWSMKTTPNDPGPLYPLPDYGKVAIDVCAAEHATPPSPPTFEPRLIRMKEHFRQLNRLAVVSSPALLRDPSRQINVAYRKP